MRVMMLYLHGTPRYQPISDAAKVCSFLTVCRGLREVLRKVCQFGGDVTKNGQVISLAVFRSPILLRLALQQLQYLLWSGVGLSQN